jgi:hypothetical protein
VMNIPENGARQQARFSPAGKTKEEIGRFG